MTATPIRICYPFVGDSIGGSHVSTLLLVKGLDRSRYDPLIVIHEEGPLADHLRALGVPFELLCLPVYAGETPNAVTIAAGMLRNLPRLSAFLKHFGVDIVHANDLRMNLTWSVATKVTGRAFVWHQRALPYSSSVLWRCVGLVADQVIYISSAVARRMGTMGRTPTCVVRNPVSAGQPAPSRAAAKSAMVREFELDPSTRIVGFVGRLVGFKRPDIFVAACGRLANRLRGVNLTFILVGNDEELLVPQLRHLATSMGIEKQIYFVGFRRNVEELIAGMDLLMATSEWDAFGRSLVEAMAMGTPVVAAGVAGHVEIIEHDRTGLLVAPNDPEAFAAAAHRVLADRALAGRLAEEGRSCAMERYSVESHVCRVAAIYDNVL